MELHWVHAVLHGEEAFASVVDVNNWKGTVSCYSILWAFPDCISGQHFTSGVPVDVGDVAGGTFANANPLAGEDVVNIHKVIVGSHSQVLP